MKNNWNLQGYLSIVLHAHLPFVRHPENRQHLEELWLFEAITDTYLPLLEAMNGWKNDQIPFRLAMSVTPTLSSMLSDAFLMRRYVEHLERSAALARDEVVRTKGTPFHPLAVMYLGRFERARETFLKRYSADLLGAFKELSPYGLEIIASAATHGLLPLLEPVRSAVKAQIRAGIAEYRRVFGENPKGFWLPECGFDPDHSKILVDEGIHYTIVDTHGLLHGEPRPRYASYAPVYTPDGLAVFARDVETSKQVWSADEGYPGDFDYREFYRDIGHDREWEAVAPYLPCGVRADTGIKYYRITGNIDEKAPYDPGRARAKAVEHAANFAFNREHQFRHLRAHMDRVPVVVAPYDAELFGHWWFEGPIFLDALVRHLHRAQPEIKLIAPSDYLKAYPTNQVVNVSASTWGYKGHHEVWLEKSNDWIYRHLHQASRRMERLARAHPNAHGEIKRALDQLARELMLAQASDWAFIMKTNSVVEYAIRRTNQHLAAFFALERQLLDGRIDSNYLEHLQWKNTALPNLDYRVYLDDGKMQERPLAPSGAQHTI